MFFVSHDRGFVERVATHVIEVKDGKVTSYPDGYATYCWRLEQEVGGEAAAAAASKTAKPEPRPAVAGTSSGNQAQRDAQSHRDATKRLKQIERELKTADARRKELETAVATNFTSANNVALAEVQQKISALEEEWLAVSEQVNGGE